MRGSTRVELTLLAASWTELCRGLAWSVSDVRALRARTIRTLQWGQRPDLVDALEIVKDGDVAHWLRDVVVVDRAAQGVQGED